jgi:hypothetical protein
MTTQMIIRLDAQKRRKLATLSKAEGKSTSEIVRGLIDVFIKEHDLAGYIDFLWHRAGKVMSGHGYTAKDIKGLIAQTRKESR